MKSIGNKKEESAMQHIRRVIYEKTGGRSTTE